MTKKKVLCVDMGGGKSSSVIMEDLAPTLACTHYGEPVVFYESDENDIRSNGEDEWGLL